MDDHHWTPSPNLSQSIDIYTSSQAYTALGPEGRNEIALPVRAGKANSERLVRSGGPAHRRARVGPPGLTTSFSAGLFPDLTVGATTCRLSDLCSAELEHVPLAEVLLSCLCRYKCNLSQREKGRQFGNLKKLGRIVNCTSLGLLPEIFA